MTIFYRNIEVHTRHELDVQDITQQVQAAVSDSEFKTGIVNIFAVGTTCAVVTIENEDGLIDDFKTQISEMIAEDREYQHNMKGGDGNGHSHIRATLLGAQLTVPFVDGELVLGAWQHIMFVELDTRSRTRIVSVTIVGE